MGTRTGIRVTAWSRGPVAVVAAVAVTAAMLGGSPAAAAPDPDDVASDVSAPAAEEAASDAETDAASELAPAPAAAPSAEPTAEPTAVPTAAPTSASTQALSVPTSTSGGWVGNPSGPIPIQNVGTAYVASSVLTKSAPPTTPADSAMVAKSQIAVSATKPKQVSTKALSTAGGLVSSKITTVPDADEVRAGIKKAGTPMVISSDASKLSTADYQALVASQPKLAKALFPVPMVGPGGTRSKSTIFRATFQAGEKIKIQGTVAPKALKKGVTLVIEKAPVNPDGTLGRFIRTHTITPNKKDGKYAQDVVVRDGFEMIRHRLLVRKTTVGTPNINWAAVEARAEEILSVRERELLAKIKAELVADAQTELPAAKAAILNKVRVPLKQDVTSFTLAHASMVGVALMTVNFNSLTGSRDITLNLAGLPLKDCNPKTTSNCQMSSIPATLNDEGSTKATFIVPTEQNTIAFSASGKNGEKYTVNWNLRPPHTTSCSKIDPNPGSLASNGSTWDIQLKTNVQMRGYLSGSPANNSWSNQWSKKQKKNKVPLGCGFKADQSFGTWFDSGGWLDILIVVGSVALAATGIGLAVDGAADAAVATEVATETAADTAADVGGDAAADAASNVALTATEESAQAIGEALAELDVEAEAALEVSDAAAEAVGEILTVSEESLAAGLAEEEAALEIDFDLVAESVGAEATEVFEAADGAYYATTAEVAAANAAVAAEAAAQTTAYIYLTGIGIGGVAGLLGLGYGASKVFASNQAGTVVVN